MIVQRLLLFCVCLSFLSLTGCTGPPRRAVSDPARVATEDLDEDGLRDLLALSQLVIVARLEERSDQEGVVRLRLRVKDTLLGEAEISKQVTASDFLYLPNKSRGGVVGPLVELSHYVFFLAPGPDLDSPWIHLRDSSSDPMPAAQELIDRIRAIQAERPAPAPSPREDSQ
ncbi:MAG: hypothetical protein JKY65_15375 [Planctomycetes bacterium]|nr:hypothetical protein [Planctomycetota bacterium]